MLINIKKLDSHTIMTGVDDVGTGYVRFTTERVKRTGIEAMNFNGSINQRLNERTVKYAHI